MSITEETGTKSAIADRAVAMFKRFNVRISKLDILMDIDGVDEVCRLNLRELLEFPDSDFSHDIGGILKNYNRDTKRLDNCFTPRCAERN